MQRSSGKQDKVLFTPGPLTTSRTVKEAALRDVGSRDLEFLASCSSWAEWRAAASRPF
jgi:aspartate aminotransferase-like enzyme